MSQNPPKDKRIKKTFFTLFEVMVVIAILTMVGLGMGFNLKGALREQQFQSSIDLFVARVQLAHELMMDYDTDISMSLSIEEGVFHCRIIPLAQLPPALLKTINQDSALKHIGAFAWNKENKTALELCFFSNSLATSGQITLFSKTEGLQEELYLPTFPCKIRKTAPKTAQGVTYKAPHFPEVELHEPQKKT